MSVDDFKFVDNRLMRKRIKLTLKTASYFGIVQRINSNKTVVLSDVVDVKNGRRFPGVKLFFGSDILNVEFCEETKSNSGEISGKANEGILNVEEFQPYKKSIFDKDGVAEEESLYIEVIEEFNEKFGPAVMHIRKQHVIGLASDGVEAFQHGRLCWLQIATKNCVYLFDILLLGAQAFKNGLSMILQSTHILKVVHDCRGISSSLLAQFGVNLTNVFDTQVADVMCFYSETGGFLPDRVSTLQEVVSLYLKVPSSRLLRQMNTRLTREERDAWYSRPCPKPLLKGMALMVIHLQPLRLVLLDTLMSDYMGVVDSYLGSSHREVDPGSVEHINMSSVFELPRELRELEHTRRERQRYALDHFSVTERGLLDRYHPLSEAPPKAAPPSGKAAWDWDGAPRMQPDATEHTQAEPPTRSLDLLHTQVPTNTHVVNRVSSSQSVAFTPTVEHPSPRPAAQATVPLLTPDRQKPPSPGKGLRLKESEEGRGRYFSKAPQASVPALPCLGRGLLHQLPTAMDSRNGDPRVPSMGRGTVIFCPARGVAAQLEPSANVLQGSSPVLGQVQFIPTNRASLSQSFSSFRKM